MLFSGWILLRGFVLIAPYSNQCVDDNNYFFFFLKHGPFEVDTSDYSKLVEREYRWNLKVNMLYIEAPVGVGFSYSTTKDYVCDDDRTANENRAAVEDFFSKFPEYKQNQLWITGESYGGIYVPTLAEAIVHGQKDGTYTGAKLSGIAVGNGCSGTEIGICGDGPQVRQFIFIGFQSIDISTLAVCCRELITNGNTC